MLVLLDTSILIFLAEKPSSFLDDLGACLGKADLCVPDSVLGELTSLSQSRGPKGRKAKLALSYAARLTSVEQGGEADDALVILAQEKRAVVATLDGKLTSSLRRRGVPVATVKSDRLLLLGIR
ncbi:MAG: PIN domain-containing protein [Conexivisphaerales archaeon]